MSHRREYQHRPAITAALLLTAMVLLAAVPALAANRQAQERTARKACLNGDFAKGVSILSDLFVDTKDPTYLFNQGRCFEQNRRYEDAVARFEEYLRAAGDRLREDDRAAAEKHLSDCREKVAQEHPTQSALPEPLTPPPAALGPVPAPAPPTTTEPTAGTLTETTSAAGPGKRRWGLITAGIITATVGVGGVVTGLVFNIKANSMVSDWENKPGAYSTANENDQKTYKTLAWVGYGVGAACVVTGAVLIGLGARSRTESPGGVALVPAVGPGQMGALLAGAF
jgi:hypothetical protein